MNIVELACHFEIPQKEDFDDIAMIQQHLTHKAVKIVTDIN